MSSRDELRAALECGAVETCREIWAKYAPHLPQLNSEDAEKSMHIARTRENYISFKSRAYSNAWLIERGLPSFLPDNLKSKAERIYPIIKSSVGISVNTKNEFLKPAAVLIRKAMGDAVEDIYANGDQANIELIKRRIWEAKRDETKRLFGRIS